MMNLSKSKEVVYQMYDFGESFRVLGLYSRSSTDQLLTEYYRQASNAFEMRSASLLLEMLKRLAECSLPTSNIYTRCYKTLAIAEAIDRFEDSFQDDQLYAAACLSNVGEGAFQAAMSPTIMPSTQFCIAILKDIRDFTEADYDYAKDYYIECSSNAGQQVSEKVEAIKDYVDCLDVLFG